MSLLPFSTSERNEVEISVSRATSLRDRARADRASRKTAPSRALDANNDSRALRTRDSATASLLVKRSESHEHVALAAGKDSHHAKNDGVFIRHHDFAFVAEEVLDDTK